MEGLSTTLDIDIRFSETDAMGVVWHGNYLKFFEDAREYFGEIYGLEYLFMYNSGFFTPIVTSSIKHTSTVRYGEKIRVKITHIPTRAAKIKFVYEVINLTTNTIAASGETVQVFLRISDNLLELNKPDFYLNWEQKHGI